MPLKKKYKLQGKIIFWTLAVIVLALMIYVPKKPAAKDNARFIEYELH
jgi:hypothetical protein